MTYEQDFERARAAAPTDSDFVYDCGRALYQLGRFSEAMQYVLSIYSSYPLAQCIFIIQIYIIYFLLLSFIAT